MLTNARRVLRAIACAALCACGGDGNATSKAESEPRPEGDFAGALDGTDAFVGVVSSAERLTVYVCDNAAISHWFIADGPRSEVALYATGGALLDAKFDGDRFKGVVTLPDGSEHSFTARRSDEPVLHRAVADPGEGDERLIAGWVTFEGETRGAIELRVGTGTRAVAGAPPLPPLPERGEPLRVTLPLPIDPNDPRPSPLIKGALSLSAPLVTVTRDARVSTPNRVPTFVVAGVGDSYGSGEGAPFDPASSDLEEPDNLDTMWGEEYGMNGCHRSENAGIVRAFRRLQDAHPERPMELMFVACGGSKISHLIDDVKGDQPTERTDRWEAIAERPQLEQVVERVAELDANGARAPIDVLAMSIGGNDAGFAPIVAACIAGGIPDNFATIDPTLVLGQLGPTCDEDPDVADALDGNGPRANNPRRSLIPGWAVVRDRYAELDAEITAISEQRPIGQVLIQHYGAGFRGSDDPDDYCGGRTGATRHDLFGFIDVDEARFVEEELLQALNAEIDDAAVAANATPAGPRWKPVSAHVEQFVTHGPCAPEPWTNTNNAALSLQGNNLPDPPDDDTRVKLAAMNTVLSTLAGGAIGCTLGPLACLAGGGFVGSSIGFVVGLATNAEESAISAGMAHPNPDGYAAVADALYPELEQAFTRTFRPARPDRMRQFGAVENGQIVVRWDDVSDTETRFELEVYELDDRSEPVHEVTLPANRTEYTHDPGGPFVGLYRVRACNDDFCSSFTGFVKATNMKARVPVDVRAEIQELDVLVNVLSDNIMTVSGADPRRADVATRIELTLLETSQGPVEDPEPQVFDVPFPFPSAFEIGSDSGLPNGRYRVRAASCNLLGCSGFSEAVESTRTGNVIKLEEPELLPPGIIDRFGRIIPPHDRPQTGPGPDPDPSQPAP